MYINTKPYYGRSSSEYKEGWKLVARLLATVNSWIRSLDKAETASHGGKRYQKVKSHHVEAMITNIEKSTANPFTNKEQLMADKSFLSLQQ